MSAAEVIEQIKTLSPEEQREVSRFVHEFVDPAVDSRGVSVENVESIADRIFDRYDPLFRKLAE